MAHTLMETAYDELRDKLFDGTIKPGERLVNRKLGEELGVNTVTVREAINRLISDGVVEHVPNAGAYVRKLDTKEIIELYKLREALECFAAVESTRKIEAHQLAQLESICRTWLEMARELRQFPDKAAEASWNERWLRNDARYHRILIEAADNRWLRKTVDDLRLMSRIMKSKPSVSSLRIAARTYRQHAALVRAIHKRDVQGAHHWMRIQMQSSLDLVMENVR